MAPVYLEHCCGQVTTLTSEHYAIYQQCLKRENGDVTNAMLRTYTGEEIYRSINKQLLQAEEELGHTGGYVQHLKLAIKERGRQRGWSAGILWRGMGIPKNKTFLYKLQGRSFVWPNFVSASYSRKIAEDFLGTVAPGEQKTLFEIDSRGVGLSYVIDLADVSDYPAEQEALFYPYSGFQIKSWSMEGDVLIVKMKTYDSKMYFDSSFAKFEECRYAFPSGEKRVPLAQCFYSLDSKKKSAMSCGLVKDYATCPASWGERSTVKALAEHISETWKKYPDRNVFFLGSGNDQWSTMFLEGFGDQQSYKHGSSTDQVKAWIKEKWSEKQNWCITSWGTNGDNYFVIMTTKAPGFESGEQQWAVRKEWKEMRDWISKNYKDGYIITEVSHSVKKGQYVVVMTKSPKAQSYTWSKDFPKEWAKQKWEENKAITKILYDEMDTSTPWFIVATSDSGSNNQWTINLGV